MVVVVVIGKVKVVVGWWLQWRRWWWGSNGGGERRWDGSDGGEMEIMVKTFIQIPQSIEISRKDNDTWS